MPWKESHFQTAQLRTAWRKGHDAAVRGLGADANPYARSARNGNGATFGESYSNAWLNGHRCGVIALRDGQVRPAADAAAPAGPAAQAAGLSERDRLDLARAADGSARRPLPPGGLRRRRKWRIAPRPAIASPPSRSSPSTPPPPPRPTVRQGALFAV